MKSGSWENKCSLPPTYLFIWYVYFDRDYPLHYRFSSSKCHFGDPFPLAATYSDSSSNLLTSTPKKYVHSMSTHVIVVAYCGFSVATSNVVFKTIDDCIYFSLAVMDDIKL